MPFIKLRHFTKTKSCKYIANNVRNVKRQPHEGDNLDERIVTIPCKRVYGATQARPCETSGCSRQRCTVKVSNKTRLFRSHEQLRYPAKNCPRCHWPTL